MTISQSVRGVSKSTPSFVFCPSTFSDIEFNRATVSCPNG